MSSSFSDTCNTAPYSLEATLSRQASFRPQKPAPPVPRRPRDSAMEELYAERGTEIDSSEELTNQQPKGEGLLNDVMSALGPGQIPVPQRRAPPPPSDPAQEDDDDWSRRPPKQLTPPPDDPLANENASTSERGVVSARKRAFERPEISAPKPVWKNGSESQTLPPARRVIRADSSVDSERPARVAVQRSTSSASSSSSGGKRPSVPPPRPPKRAPLVETEGFEDEEENYYDVIPSPLEEKPTLLSANLNLPAPTYSAMRVKDRSEEAERIAGQKQRPPLPEKPPKGQSKVSAMAARFDPKSGSVASALLK